MKHYKKRAMNGIGQIMVDCIEAIPKEKDEYQKNKDGCKREISSHMLLLLSEEFDVSNSTGVIPHQKVIFGLEGKNCGEVEMRNGEDVHHREMKFRLHKRPITQLLIRSFDEEKQEYPSTNNIIVYGNAIRKFIN